MIIIVKVSVKHKILSVETVLSAYTYTHTHTHTRTHAHTHARTHARTLSLSLFHWVSSILPVFLSDIISFIYWSKPMKRTSRGLDVCDWMTPVYHSRLFLQNLTFQWRQLLLKAPRCRLKAATASVSPQWSRAAFSSETFEVYYYY